MDNIIILTLTLLCTYLILTRKKRRFTYRTKLLIISIVMITVFFTVPLTLLYAVRHPLRTTAYGMKMTIAYLRVRGDITRMIDGVDDRVGKYIPIIIKKGYRVVKDKYRRYKIETNIQYARAVVGR